jgi:exoribonuclease R
VTTIPIEVSAEQLLRAVERLPQQELETFVAQILVLRAQRSAPHLDQEETALLLQINAGISPELQRRFNELVAQRELETISPAALTELIQITDEIEQRDAQRLAALIELAQHRQTTVPNLMAELGIRPPAHV